jgi:microcystin-dependent protein
MDGIGANVSGEGSVNAINNDPGHNHAFTTGSSFTGVTTNNNGGSNAHNNMQPTLFLGNLFIYSGKPFYANYPFTAGTNLI